jgi:hypothetical protein
MNMSMNPNLLLLMGGIHFVLMFVLMYSMVDRFENIFVNFNQVYMAAIMTSPMLLLEIWLMGHMYANMRILWSIAAGAVLVFAAAFLFIRQQTAIGDKEFLRSMIPHHGAALLMCEEAPIEDAQIQDLCQRIIAGQEAEIEEMKEILERLE